MDGVAVPGKLRLKKDSGVKKKKKSLKTDLKEKLGATVAAFNDADEATTASSLSTNVRQADDDNVNDDDDQYQQQKDVPKLHAPKKTKAELTFERRQAALQADRIIKKAQTSHRERVEEFNSKMDTLTEFNDIPKVSWTK